MPSKNFIVLCALIIFLNGCSKLQEDLPTQPQAPAVQTHQSGWLDTLSTNFHGNYIRQHQWDLASCQKCHGDDYSGGIAESSCNTCHKNTPEGCTTCHGGVNNNTGAPPKDLQGNKATTFKGVGAHTIHLTGGALSNGFACTECHEQVEKFDDADHIGSELLPAEIDWGELADEDDANPSWDGVQTCQNVYCHGEFELGNQDNNPSWIKVDGTQATCGLCHGLPPAAPHSAVTQCYLCHPNVVNASFEIIGKDKHINGKTDY